MADEDKDVNEDSEASTESTQEQGEQGSSEDTESSTSDSGEQRVPYSRFVEVNEDRNFYRSKVEELEARLDRQEKSSGNTPVDKAIERLMDGGMDKESAKILVESQIAVAQDIVNSTVKPVEAQSKEAQIQGWINDLSKKHEDYSELEPEMNKAFGRLSKKDQAFVAGSKAGLEMLYSQVKLSIGTNDSYKKGVKDGYKTKQLKKSVSSGSKGTTGSEALPTLEEIARMPSKEYAKKRDLILQNQEAIVKKSSGG